MIIQNIKKGPLEYIVIDDFYSDEEINVIKKEFIDLLPFAKLPQETSTSKDNNNKYKKNCLGLFLNEHYKENIFQSNIFNITSKILNNSKIFVKALQLNAFFKNIRNCNAQGILLNYYKDQQEYLPHVDKSVLTIISTFKIDEFSGGEFCFPEYDEVLEFKENRIIIFAGCVEHQAKKIEANNDSYRLSIAQFLYYNQ